MKNLLVWCLILLTALCLPAQAKRRYGAPRGKAVQAQSAPAYKSPLVWSGWSRTGDSSIMVRYGRTGGSHPVWHWQFRNLHEAPTKVTFSYNTVAQTKPAKTVEVPAKSISRDMFDAALDGKLKPDVKVKNAE
jgi:hypothetical protein